MPAASYGPSVPVLSADGQCTGFPDSLGPWDWHQCCVQHDAGGTDGQLLDCVASSVPGWAEVIVVLCIALMVLLRPIYTWLQRHHIVK